MSTPDAPDAAVATDELALRSSVQDAYNATGSSWVEGPLHVYGRLARALVACSPIALDGTRILDAGAGTGALSTALHEVGARPIAVDVAHEMLAAGRRAATEHDTFAPAATAGDAMALPFRTAAFDGAGAAFSLSHVPSPAVALQELARVVRPGGVVLASCYGDPNPHPVKAAVDAAAATVGFVPPPWYAALKRQEELVGSAAALTALAQGTGLVEVHVDERRVDVDLRDGAALVRWRMGMPHVAPFVATLSAAQRASVVEAALDAIGPDPEPYRPDVLFLRARVA